jgi:sialate O-acetylesterase
VPTVLFNGLVNPVVPFGIRGALWYQGESNRGGAAEYAELMPALIADWRARFGRPTFPFFFVQIAPFDYDKTRTATAELRQAQLETLRVKETGMVVTMDVGDPKDIHPKNKQEVGRRLSLWALAKCYGRTNLECSGPLFESLRVDGNAIRVRFTHCAGLTSKGGPPQLFEVAGADGKFYEATAAIDGETVVMSSPQVKEPKEARFAFTDSGAVNLFNGAGLPASPFCRIARPAN